MKKMRLLATMISITGFIILAASPTYVQGGIFKAPADLYGLRTMTPLSSA